MRYIVRSKRMDSLFLRSIDWQRPWLAPYRELGRSLMHADWRAGLNARAAAIRNSRGLPIHFVPQSSLPPDTPYEAFINRTGGVPTRENLHDFFNALMWLNFPRIKVQLNTRQAAEIERAAETIPGHHRRGAVRDAATLFDENAALLVLRGGALLDAFRGHRWSEIFLDRRSRFHEDCEVILFGHALMEKLVHPYKAITAHALPVIADAAFFELDTTEKLAWLDERLAVQVEDELSTTIFTPLPVLGVPGWWEGQGQDFYADTSVFRPRRSPR